MIVKMGFLMFVEKKEKRINLGIDGWMRNFILILVYFIVLGY